ncbi:MAG: DUF4886 domain-containing protein [Rubripirellula sp.]
MQKTIPLRAVFIGLILMTSAHAEPRTVRVLTVGNSFAENALAYLPQITEASGNQLIFGKANLGGCSLERHWRHVEKFEANPEDPEGRPYGKAKQSLAERLKADQWDYVTIQQASFLSHDRKTIEPYGLNLSRYIRKHAPHAKLLIHQTWAYRVDDPRFVPTNEGKQPHTQELMYRSVRAEYHALADKLAADLIPSGDAMFLADTNPTWGFRPDANFDFKSATPPALPQQIHSLHTGWRWKDNKDGSTQLRLDGHHASRAGRYLLGCVWFEALFDQSVVDNSFQPKDIDPEYAKFLRSIAHRAVADLKTNRLSRADRILNQIKNPSESQVMIAAHRGGYAEDRRDQAPENTVANIEVAISRGFDLYETDIRRTSDGVFVIVHDGTLDRETTGSGPVEDVTSSQLQKLRKRYRDQSVSTEPVATLEDFLRAGKDRMLFKADLKPGVIEHFDALSRLIDQHQMSTQVLLRTGFKDADAIARCFADGTPHVEVMFKVDTAKQVSKLAQKFANHPLLTIQVNIAKGESLTKEKLAAIQTARQKGYLVETHIYDDRDQWRELIDAGVRMFHTSSPDALRAYLDR